MALGNGSNNWVWDFISENVMMSVKTKKVDEGGKWSNGSSLILLFSSRINKFFQAAAASETYVSYLFEYLL